MGQYYKPINLDKKQYLYSHDCRERIKTHDGRTVTIGTGLKLMEHSWIGNKFVASVEKLIAKSGAWFGDRIVWAGDYADPEEGQTKQVPKYMSEEQMCAGQMPEMETRELNLFDLIDDDVDPAMKIKPVVPKTNYRYVINLDSKEFVDKNKVPISDVYEEDGKEYLYVIHPLPLLTCEGNGRGGGDFHKDDPLVGKWARQRVTVSNKVPEGFTEIKFNLFEGKKPAKLKKKAEVPA